MNRLLSNPSELIMFGIAAVLLFAAELIYFRIAARFSIIDKPGNRSSHTGNIIRGGGVIFYIALLAWFVRVAPQWKYFMLAATLVAVISFLDDVKPQRTSVRFAVHLLAVMLLFYQTGVYEWSVWLVVLAAIVCIGTINAFNFMDGINGITGIYGLVNLGTFLYINVYVAPFSDTALMIITGIAVIIFLVFNFRKQARCFAGDVGSTTLAFIQIFLLLQLIVYTQNFFWVIMFLVFGIDSVVTILYRLVRRENIFRAHRTHLYQYMSNETGVPHTTTSVIYGLIQLTLNISLILCLPGSNVYIPFTLSVGFLILYLLIRHKLTPTPT